MRSSYPRKSFVFVLLAIALFSLSLICNAQSGWTPELEMKVNAVGAVRVSPDGKKVAYTVNAAVMTPDKSEFVSQIWVANSDDREPVQLTYAEKSSDRHGCSLEFKL